MNERSLFLAALDIPHSAERAAYLARACVGDDALRVRVETLVRSHREVGSYLGTPALAQGGRPPAGDQTEAIDGTGSRTSDPYETQAEPGTGGAASDDALRFLAPGRQPGSLGRLAHYEILEVLGQGGFGTVLKAFDDKLHRVVAIKILAPALAASGTSRQRFVREARTAAAVRHEHIVVIHAVDDDPLPYLVMECIIGHTLQDKIDRVGPLAVKEALRIGHQIAAGLAAAHAQGLVHRDIKPANVLLENGIERVKITDFGLAKVADDASLTQSGVIAGTPMFMAPEQALGGLVDHRADLFSLGSVLYTMLAGRPPFRASGTLAVLKRVCEDTPRPISEVNPEVPEWLEAVVARLHEKKPEDRFQSAREVADVLADGLAGMHARGGVRPVVLPTKPGPRPQRGRGAATPGRRRALAAGLVILAALTAGGTLLYRNIKRDRGPESNRADPDGPPVAASANPPPAVAPFDAAQAKAHQEAWAKHLSVDVEVTNSVDMKLRLIPPGQFLKGSPKPEVDALVADAPPDWGKWVKDVALAEWPQREVVLARPFYMGIHEVTVGQFRHFTRETGFKTGVETSGRGGPAWDSEQNKVVENPKQVWHNPRFAESDWHPVVLVTLDDAEAFCAWLGRKEGRQYRVPTDDEWEYACRAGTTTRWWCGDDFGAVPRYERAETSAPMRMVGSLVGNPFGLFDMHGNAEEATRGADDRCVVRGARGPWFSRSAHRHPKPKTDTFYLRGFRVALVGDLKAKSPAAAAGPSEPFAVLVGDAIAERTFAGLAAAAAAARSGDTIEIRGDGPFETPPVDLGTKALAIRAGDGCRPVLRLDVRRPTKGKALLASRAPLVLEGVELQRLVDPDDGENLHAVVQAFGPFRMANVRVVQTGNAQGVAVHCPDAGRHGPSEVVNSQLTTGWSAIDVWGREADSALVVRNSICHGSAGVHVAIHYHLPKKLAVRLERNTFAGGAAVGATISGPGDWLKPGRAAGLVSVEAADNVLAGRSALWSSWMEDTAVKTGDQRKTGLRNTVGWKEGRNLYRCQNFWDWNHDGGPDPHTYEDWRKFWNVAGPAGLTGDPAFVRADPDELMNRPTPEVRKALMPGDFRLAEGSPGKGKGAGGKDLGADVDLVGPGPAYEKWKKTPEYQQWLARTKEFLAGK